MSDVMVFLMVHGEATEGKDRLVCCSNSGEWC